MSEDTEFANVNHGSIRTTAFATTNVIRHHPTEHVHFNEANKGKGAKAKVRQSTEPATGQQPQYESKQSQENLQRKAISYT